MKIKYPNYLQYKDDDDFLLKTFKQAGRNEADEICKTGINSEYLNTIRIATELGDDMKAPLLMSAFITVQAECRYLADIRFLIENYQDGGSLPLWRERHEAFNRMQDNLAASPIIHRERKFIKGGVVGRLNQNNKYLKELIVNNPTSTAKELYKIALKDASEGNSPFNYDHYDGGTLLDGEKELSYTNFANRLSKVKNKNMK